MKTVKWIAAVLLLSGLVVSTAGAATYYVDYAAATAMDMSGENVYRANDPSGDSIVYPGVAAGATFTHTYDFNVTDILGLTAQAIMNVTVGGASIADLTFSWDTGSSAVVTNASGVATGTVTFTDFLASGLHTLTVTGKVIEMVPGADLDTAYDFSIYTTSVPIPAAFWLLGSALVGFVGFGRRRSVA